MKYTIEIVGLDDLLRKCKSDVLIAKAWRRAMARATGIVKSQAKKRAPKQTGRLAAAVTSRMSPSAIPLWSIVTDDAERGGVRYPFILNAGTGKSGSTLHYRSGKSGKPTRGWFTGALGVAKGKVASILRDAAHDIEVKWGH